MKISTSRFGTTQVVCVEDTRIDAAVAIAFKDHMRDLVQEGTHNVILDLKEVNFIDSSGLGAIVAVMKQLGKGNKLHLAGLKPNVDKVFRMTRMDTVFDIFSSVDSALSEDAK